MAAICPSTVAVQKDWALLALPLPLDCQPRGEAIPWQPSAKPGLWRRIVGTVEQNRGSVAPARLARALAGQLEPVPPCDLRPPMRSTPQEDPSPLKFHDESPLRSRFSSLGREQHDDLLRRRCSSRLGAAQFLRTTPSHSTHHVRATLMDNSTEVGPSSVLEACGRDSGHRCHNGGTAPVWCWYPVRGWLRGPRQLQERDHLKRQERDHLKRED